MGALADAAGRLGFPWDRLADAVAERQEAEQAAELALEGRNAATCAVAATNLELAVRQEKTRRGDVADALLVLLRCATEERFNDLWGLVMAFAVKAEWRKEVERLFSTQPGGATWAVELEKTVREQAAEIDRLTSAVARLKGENWELALWVKEIQAQLNTTGGAAHGHSGAGGGADGTAAGDDIGRCDVRHAG